MEARECEQHSKELEELENRLRMLEQRFAEISIVVYGSRERNVEGLIERYDRLREEFSSQCEEVKVILQTHARYFNYFVGGCFVISVGWGLLQVFLKLKFR